MFGYLTPDRDELRIREFSSYRAHYCGICASLRDRYSYPFCAFLSYDAALIALIAAAYSHDETESTMRCLINPFVKLKAWRGPAEDYAADANLLYAYYKCRDDLYDDGGLRARTAEWLTRGPAKRAKDRLGMVADDCEAAINALTLLEKAKSEDIDATSIAWAEAMASLFRNIPGVGRDAVALDALGRDLGRWIYILDACDDLDRDEKKGSYNVLLSRFGSAKAARGELDHIAWILSALQNSAQTNAQLLKDDLRAPIWRNIIERGIYRRSQEIFAKWDAETGEKNESI